MGDLNAALETDGRFVMRHDRVNVDPRYLAFKQTFRPSRDAVRKLHEDTWRRQFFTASELESLLPEA